MLLMVLLACVSVEKEEPGFGSTQTEDSGEVEAGTEAVSARGQLSDGTILEVTTSFPQAVRAWVEFGPSEGYGYQTPPQALAAGSAEIPLIGMPAAATWHWRVAAEAEDGTRYTSADQTVHLPTAPASLPAYTVTVGDLSFAQDWILAPMAVEGWVALYNRAGQPVWWTDFPTTQGVTEARLSKDGRAVFYILGSMTGELTGASLVKVDLRTHARQSWPLSAAHHGFTEMPDGRLAVIVADIRDTAEYGPVVGDSIQLLSEDGSTETVWSVWDVLDPYFANPRTAARIPDGYDWSHCNSLSYDTHTDQFLTSCYNLRQVMAIHASTGALAWTFGLQEGLPNTLTQTGGGEAITAVHSPVAVEGGVLLFNNRESADETIYSEVVQLALDLEAGTWARAWVDDGDQSHFTFALGNAERLEDGDTFSVWGNMATLRQVDAEGQVVWQAERSAGGVAGFGQRVAWLGGIPE